jgi:hypothetical protein
VRPHKVALETVKGVKVNEPIKENGQIQYYIIGQWLQLHILQSMDVTRATVHCTENGDI